MVNLLHKRWIRIWLRLSGASFTGRIASRMAAIGFPPFHGQVVLANFSRNGFTSPKAMIHHPLLETGHHVYIGDGVYIYQDDNGGPVKLKNRVKLIGNTSIQTGAGGRCEIGAGTSIQPNCQLSAFIGPITIGNNVDIGPHCAFYSYNHSIEKGEPIRSQSLRSMGGVTIEDDAWLSVGVIVLDGVRIGQGAVVGAGAVVTTDLPANAIAAGVPARIIRMRDGRP